MDLQQRIRDSVTRISDTLISATQRELNEMRETLFNPPVGEIHNIRNNIPIIPRYQSSGTTGNTETTGTTGTTRSTGTTGTTRSTGTTGTTRSTGTTGTTRSTYNNNVVFPPFLNSGNIPDYEEGRQIVSNLVDLLERNLNYQYDFSNLMNYEQDVRHPVSNDILIHLRVVENSNIPDGLSCPICLESFNTENDTPNNDSVVLLPCNHHFHKKCITEWFTRSTTCPVCKQNIDDLNDIRSEPLEMELTSQTDLLPTSENPINPINTREITLIRLRLRTKNGNIISRVVPNNIQILQLMENFGLDSSNTKLVFLTKVLENHLTLDELKLKDGDLLVECN